MSILGTGFFKLRDAAALSGYLNKYAGPHLAKVVNSGGRMAGGSDPFRVSVPPTTFPGGKEGENFPEGTLESAGAC